MTILSDGSFTCLFAQHLAKQETQAAAAWWVRQVYFRIRNNIKDFDFSFSFCVCFGLATELSPRKHLAVFIYISSFFDQPEEERLQPHGWPFSFLIAANLAYLAATGCLQRSPARRCIYIYTLYVRVVLSSLFVTTSPSSFSGFGFQDESRRACCSHFFFF